LADGTRVASKDVCEADHVLADFAGRYLPTLADFAAAIAPIDGEAARFDEIAAPYRDDAAAMQLLASPYAVTGLEQALLITHNTWFLSEILPRLCSRVPSRPRGVPPAELFGRMTFELWMDNGAVPPPSAPRGIRRSGDHDVHRS
ncbi:MAG TPA: hypothetical protein VGG28_17030, partial [Kofleriaceae bacterium]